MVSINKVGFGKFVIAPFNSDKALLDVINFFKIFLDSKSELGGNNGKSLYGVSGL
jgi:hypothetical protein